MREERVGRCWAWLAYECCGAGVCVGRRRGSEARCYVALTVLT
jgi:hypothetical protein